MGALNHDANTACERSGRGRGLVCLVVCRTRGSAATSGAMARGVGAVATAKQLQSVWQVWRSDSHRSGWCILPCSTGHRLAAAPPAAMTG